MKMREMTMSLPFEHITKDEQALLLSLDPELRKLTKDKDSSDDPSAHKTNVKSTVARQIKDIDPIEEVE